MSRFSTLLCATGLAITLAIPAQAQDASTVLATVNGTEITLGHVIALQDRLPAQYKALEDDVLYEGLLEQLIQQTALRQAYEKDPAKSIDIKIENEMRAFLAGELLAKVGLADLEEGALDAAYKEQYLNVDSEEEYSAAHILVDSEEKALEIRKELDAGADFAELAKEKSDGPSGANGGDLGWFGKGAMVPEFENAVLGMKDGEVSDPVQTQFGWHILIRKDSRAIAAPAFDDVRDDLERELRADAVENAVNSISAAAKIERAEVEIDPAIIRQKELLEN